ncbi:MAG: hypothetical protein CMJ32_00060 [Phycisphaerae bacterium]|nr:hypothetical protein [Phycisphaerae bacterium]
MMTDDQIDLAIFRAVARGLSTPMRHSVARSMGILPPRNVSIDAGKPMPRDGSDWSDQPPQRATRHAEPGAVATRISSQGGRPMTDTTAPERMHVRFARDDQGRRTIRKWMEGPFDTHTASFTRDDLMERRIAEAVEADGWRPIDTAPRDGHGHHSDRGIDLYHAEQGRVADCYWRPEFKAWFKRTGGRAYNMGADDRFTHWRPKPSAPAAIRSTQEGEGQPRLSPQEGE